MPVILDANDLPHRNGEPVKVWVGMTISPGGYSVLDEYGARPCPPPEGHGMLGQTMAREILANGDTSAATDADTNA